MTFEWDVRRSLSEAGDFVTFLCDDDILFAEAQPYDLKPNWLCYSWRLGANTLRCYPTGKEQRYLGGSWPWRNGQGDFGYPGSLDGHTFRTEDVVQMLGSRTFANPTELEDALNAGCHELTHGRLMMACPPRSVLCSVPVNRVSEQSQVRFGVTHPASAEALNERFLAGGRLDLDAMDFSGVDSAHYEVEMRWR